MEENWTKALKEAKSRLKRRAKTARKTVLKCSSKLQECLGWSNEEHEAQLIQAFLYQIKKGAPFVIVNDWEKGNIERKIDLDPSLPPHLEIAKRFKKAKKHQKGIHYAECQLNLAERHLEEILHLQSQLECIEGKEAFLEILPLLPEEQKIQKMRSEEAKQKPYYHYQGPDGASILVGKSATKNDALTFKHARGNDFWLHATGVAGSHVVLQMQKGAEPSKEALEAALQLALYHSKARNRGEGEVSVTQVKYVKKSGSTPGKVQIAQEKRFKIILKKINYPRL